MLQARLGVGEEPLPAVALDPQLEANARYDRDTIWLGTIQRAFHHTEDTLSLIYHEYIHHQLRGRYPVATDSTGFPVQWVTDQTYWYRPSALQLEQELAQTEGFWAGLPPEQRKLHHDRLRRDLAQPRLRVLRYAPSNLAREEIEAYQQQLAAAERGLYALSPAAQQAILIRLHQLQSTLQQRLRYEAEQGLGPEGIIEH